MIVDLLRNDLSRVCRPDSVRVEQLCAVETYEFVQHLVSVVRGQLAENRTPIDLLRAAFPGGSITGAPKVRAMEIISELEPTARGAYCGSLGYPGLRRSPRCEHPDPDDHRRSTAGGNCPWAGGLWPSPTRGKNTTRPGTKLKGCCAPFCPRSHDSAD